MLFLITTNIYLLAVFEAIIYLYFGFKNEIVKQEWKIDKSCKDIAFYHFGLQKHRIPLLGILVVEALANTTAKTFKIEKQITKPLSSWLKYIVFLRNISLFL